MADFIWDYTLLELTTSISGGVYSSVLITDTEVSLVTSVEMTLTLSNPVGTADVDMVVAVSGQFVFTYVGSNVVRWSDLDNLNFDLTAANESGWKALEWEGPAWRALKFKNAVLVYGSGGVSALLPVSDPIATWSEVRLDSAGILGKDTVVDSDQFHLFIGKDYQLYAITENSQSLKATAIPVIKLLGYKEFIKALTGSIRMFYEPIEKITYIGGDNKTFLMRNNEITEVEVKILGAVFTSKLYRAGGTASGSVTLRTQELRFGTTNFKTIQTIAFDLDLHLVSSITCRVWYRDPTTQLFTLYKEYPVTADGQAFVHITAKEFQISVTYTPSSTMAIREFKPVVQFSDKRFGYGGTDVKQITA